MAQNQALVKISNKTVGLCKRSKLCEYVYNRIKTIHYSP
jgi:hypothetical protein